MSTIKKRRFVTGKVTSDKMEKSISVTVTGKKKHPKYKKYVPTRTRYHAHDEKNEAKIGDVVQISFTRPLSKQKCWKLDKIITVAD